MRFTKPSLTLDEQVEHLLARGMMGDRDAMRKRLASVNYCRLSAYWHTFRDRGGERGSSPAPTSRSCGGGTCSTVSFDC